MSSSNDAPLNVFTPTGLAALSGDWTLDPAESTVEFTGRHFLFFPVTGSVPVRSGRAGLDAAGSLTHLDATVGVAAFDTGNPQRDRKVRGPGFLDAGRFPVLRYAGERVAQGAPPVLTGVLTGVLTVKEREVPVDFTVDEVTADGEQVVVRATAEVDRHVCGVGAMRAMVGPRLALRVRAVFVRTP
ncbi:YceI-like domain protein [Streptomyces sp. ADI92-24]|uniref:YceI family protein n=1 Tax=Streptomyces sp. ADI92-24 TaxID=1522756 RepID=UPI000F554DCB|nr:YceI family protein [Streptomyces sp. ADI92-24]RPK46119.1 YceI-like domain protein [Streptomyces sp. ADI92-24]